MHALTAIRSFIRTAFLFRLALVSDAALAILAALSFAVHPARGAVTEAWVQRYTSIAGSSNDKAVQMVRDAAGDVFVTGSSENGATGMDILTVKYSSADGSILWQRRYNNPAGGTSNTDEPVALAVDGAGNAVVTGRTYRSGYGYDWITLKYGAADGAVVWEQAFHTRGDDHPHTMAVDGDGNAIVMGGTWEGNVFTRYVVKYAAANGALVWTKNFRGSEASRSVALVVDGGGNVTVDAVGLIGDKGPGQDHGRRTIRYAAADGTVLWETSRREMNNLTSLAVDAAGNVVRGSAFGSDGAGNWFAYYMVKYAAESGLILWEHGILDPGAGGLFLSLLAIDDSGNVALVRSAGNVFDQVDYQTAKFAAADGSLMWEKRYSGLFGITLHQPRVMTVDGSGNVVVAGELALTVPPPAGGIQYEFWTACYAAANGALLWEKRADTAVDSRILTHSVAVDAGGDAVVAGTYNSDSSLFGSDFYTVKYAAPDGAKLWEKLYNGPAHSDDKAKAVAMDSAGNVIVTGTATNGSSTYTAKYAAANGVLMWEDRTRGGSVVAVDSADNVIVTGAGTIKFRPDGTTAWSIPTGGRGLAVDAAGNVIIVTGEGGFYTAKYAAADGALLWARGTMSQAETWYFAAAVTVDAGGNVIATGATGGDISNDYYTVKYAAADGALLWEKRFDSEYHSEDVAAAVAVDAAGNVIVTGRSKSGFDTDVAYASHDIHTIKYAAANGAVLWEKRYDFGASDDYGNAVAVDAAGDVVVTGSSALRDFPQSGFEPPNTYTVKYAAADGARLWEQRDYGGSGAASLALDAAGNAIVTGPGFYTAKYAAADGAKLWRRHSRSGGAMPGTWDSLSPTWLPTGNTHSLALGPQGLIAIAGYADGDTGRNNSYDFETILYREIPGPVSFAAWIASFDLTGVDATPGADPDHDGLPNGVEYITGGNPTLATTSAPLSATYSNGRMLLSFSRADTAESEDVSVVVETSTDLVTWRPSHVIHHYTTVFDNEVTIAENGDDPDTITVAIPVEYENAAFARLKVSIAP